MRITLSHDERELILSYGYPNPGFEGRLKRKRGDPNEASFVIEGFEIEMLVGDLSRSMNHGEVPTGLLEDVDALASYLESLI